MKPMGLKRFMNELKHFGNNDHKIIMGDAMLALDSIEDCSIDLIFADPPYNIGKNFNGYIDKWTKDEDYLYLVNNYGI
ncbi:MAG: hypothetical protein HQK91_06755 [Nitrospirae bacterium]|nr:hypothetical protein [Nitrospirota bacterium]